MRVFSRHWLNLLGALLAAGALGLIVAKNLPREDRDTLLNVSYDPTRELYQHLDAAFVSDYAQRTGRHLRIVQSHGGSARQSRAVIDGLSADVVTLALPSDVEALHKHGLIADGILSGSRNTTQGDCAALARAALTRRSLLPARLLRVFAARLARALVALVAVSILRA